jgi:hypothetical protein
MRPTASAVLPRPKPSTARTKCALANHLETSEKNGGPGEIRTHDLCLRRAEATLQETEVRAPICSIGKRSTCGPMQARNRLQVLTCAWENAL